MGLPASAAISRAQLLAALPDAGADLAQDAAALVGGELAGDLERADGGVDRLVVLGGHREVRGAGGLPRPRGVRDDQRIVGLRPIVRRGRSDAASWPCGSQSSEHSWRPRDRGCRRCADATSAHRGTRAWGMLVPRPTPGVTPAVASFSRGSVRASVHPAPDAVRRGRRGLRHGTPRPAGAHHRRRAGAPRGHRGSHGAGPGRAPARRDGLDVPRGDGGGDRGGISDPRLRPGGPARVVERPHRRAPDRAPARRGGRRADRPDPRRARGDATGRARRLPRRRALGRHRRPVQRRRAARVLPRNRPPGSDS